jgi:hypothetical protein
MWRAGPGADDAHTQIVHDPTVSTRLPTLPFLAYLHTHPALRFILSLISPLSPDLPSMFMTSLRHTIRALSSFHPRRNPSIRLSSCLPSSIRVISSHLPSIRLRHPPHLHPSALTPAPFFHPSSLSSGFFVLLGLIVYLSLSDCVCATTYRVETRM